MKIPIRALKRSTATLLVGMAMVFLCFAAAQAASGEGEHGAEPKGWVATDNYRVMNFAVLAIALVFLLRKPLSQALNGRITGIKKQLADLEGRKEAAEKELVVYNQKLAQLEQEAGKLIGEYVKQGEDAKARILKEAEAAAEKFETQARRNIEHEFEEAKVKLKQEAFEKALVKAEEMIKEKMTSKDQDRLVNEYLKKVVA